MMWCIDSDLVLESGKWYFVSATYDGRGGITAYQGLNIYVNGQLTGVSTFTADSYTAMANTTAPFTAGVYASNWMDGQLSNIKVFGSALTAAQVADLYLNPEKIVPDGVADSALKLWLPMMEGAGTTAYDGSGNGNDGTINGATWVSGIGAPVAQTALVSWNKGTNLALYSEQFDNAYWTKTAGTTITANTTISPDGYQNADTIAFAGSGDSINRFVTTGLSVVSGTTYTFSVFTKSTTQVVFFGGATGGTGTNVYNGAVDYGNGWYRQSVTRTWSASGTVSVQLVLTLNAAGSTILYGFQAELGAYATSYIPTLATAQTSPVLLPQGLTANKDITGVNAFESARNPYALNLDGASWGEVHDNASLDITSAITLEAWVYWDGTASDDGILGRWGDSAADRCYMLYGDPNKVYFYISSSSIFHEGMATGWRHIVGTYDKINTKIYIDGQQETSSTAITIDIPTSSKNLEIGTYRYGGSRNYNDQIALPRIYNRALTATEVARNYNADRSKFGL
jgi:hypothetical protein